ncbi:MAG: multicopper oxidase domain-containing protein [Actinobacteria bacterium]|nr:multicopper oxidase domain-containing protein [Actinomycetota bacterium]
MAEISRRQFIAAAAAFAGALAIGRPAGVLAAMSGGGMGGGGGGGMGGGGGGGGMGGGTIDPAVGAAFQDPPALRPLRAADGFLEYSLNATVAPVNVNGTVANLMTYNGLFPGGTITAKTSDLLRIRFHNSLPNNGATNFLGHPMYVTNLHTHGLHVTPGDNPNMAPYTPGSHGDNMLVMLQPGESTVYEYDLSKHYPGTLNFYHPHIHGSVTDQMWAGMAGSLVVEDEVTTLAGYETHIMMVKDITLSGSSPAPHTSIMEYMHGLEGNTVMVNGQVNPRLTIRPGQVQRWRIVNSCTARFLRLSLSSHTMYVVGTESGLLDRPYPVSEVLLSPGERIELLIKADKSSSSYKFLSLPYSRMGMMTSAQITLLTLTYGGSRTVQNLPATVNAAAKRVVMDISKLPKKSIVLSMGQGAGYINGITFVDHEHCYTAMSNVGDWEVWEVLNSSNMDHPFHHHVNAAQVLSIIGGDAKYTSLYTTTSAWKDVTIVPKGGKIQLLMPVMDCAGMAMFHCHIIDHEDIGMMGMWHMMDGGMGDGGMGM